MTISALKQSLSLIQLKLSDFTSGLHESVDKIIADRLSRKNRASLTSTSAVLMLDGRRFELVNPLCPVCGSRRVTKQEFRARKPRLADLGELKIYMRRNRCKRCGKRFTTQLESVIKANDQYASLSKGYSRLRELQLQVYANYGLLLSRQATWNWIENEKRKVGLQPSDYYCYDEEYLRMNGERRYRLTLFDHIADLAVEEDMVDNLEAGTIEGFLRQALRDKPLMGITTDGTRDYRAIVEGLGAVHQVLRLSPGYGHAQGRVPLPGGGRDRLPG